MLKDTLKAWRQSFGLSQKELAEKIGISLQRYNHYETGRREPDEKTLTLIADFYHVEIADIFSGNPSRAPIPPLPDGELLLQTGDMEIILTREKGIPVMNEYKEQGKLSEEMYQAILRFIEVREAK